MKRILSVFLLILFAPFANAQTFSISGDNVACTLTETTYTVDNLPAVPLNCTRIAPTWTITYPGREYVNIDGNSCTVRWGVEDANATIKYTVNYSGNGACDSVSTPVFSVQVGIGTVTPNLPASVIAGSATPVEFSVTKKRDVAYLWQYAVQPQNEWKRDGGADPGSFININDFEDAHKTIVLPGFNSQNMFVRVKTNNCVDFDFFEQFVTVVPPSTLELESSTGSFAIPCVSTSPITFSIKNLRDGLPLTYRWRLPGGNWNSNNSASKRLTVQPDGVQAGILEVEVDMVVNGIPVTVRGSQKITLAPNTTVPVGVVDGLYFCEWESRFIFTPILGAVEYYWYSENGVWIDNTEATVSNPYYTTNPNVMITAHMNYGEHRANLYMYTVNKCGQKSPITTINMYVGPPKVFDFVIKPISIPYFPMVCYKSMFTLEVDFYDPVAEVLEPEILEYQWKVFTDDPTDTDQFYLYSGQNRQRAQFIAADANRPSQKIGVRVRTRCGWSEYTSVVMDARTEINGIPCKLPLDYEFIPFPNPADGDDIIGIFLNDHGETLCMCIGIDKLDIIDIHIYDQMGMKVQDVSTKDGSATIKKDKKVYFKLNNLPTGKYTISVDSPRGKFNANMIVK